MKPNLPLMTRILAALTEQSRTQSQLAEALGCREVKPVWELLSYMEGCSLVVNDQASGLWGVSPWYTGVAQAAAALEYQRRTAEALESLVAAANVTGDPPTPIAPSGIVRCDCGSYGEQLECPADPVSGEHCNCCAECRDRCVEEARMNAASREA